MNNYTTRIFLAITIILGASLFHLDTGLGICAAETPNDSFAVQQCIEVMVHNINHADSIIPKMSEAAEVVAQRWVDGTDLYTAGDPCATDELFYRAGGLVGIKRVGPYNRDFNGIQVRWNKVKPKKSIILYTMHRNINPDILLFEDLRHLLSRGDTVVLFGSNKWIACQRIVKALQKGLPADRFFFIDSALPQDTSFSTADGIHYGDYAGMATTIHSWTFMAELIAACTRHNKTPVIWPSGAIPGYEVWEEKYQTTTFHDDISVAPITGGVLGKKYLHILRKQLRACTTSIPQIQDSAKILAAVPADRAVYVMINSHLLANETRFPHELPNWILAQRSWRWRNAAPTVEKGDAIFWLDDFNWPSSHAELAIKMDNTFVGLSLNGPGQDPQHPQLITPGVESQSDDTAVKANPQPPTVASPPSGAIWIPAPWQYPDAVLDIDGYPLPACPTSSIIQGTLLWGLIGEILNNRK